MRMTKQRKAIIELFEEYKEQAMSAEMIHSLITEKKKEEMNLSTVYRNLAMLQNTHMIHQSMIDSIAYYYLTTKDHKHFMLCTSCKKLFPINCFIKKFLPALAKEHDFMITDHDISIVGLCNQCVH